MKKCLAEWCEELNLNRWTVASRLKAGWSITTAFEIQPKHKMSSESLALIWSQWNSGKYSKAQLSRIHNVSKVHIGRLLKQGEP